MGEWKECKLGELIADKSADLQTGPFGTMLNASEYVIEGTPVIAFRILAKTSWFTTNLFLLMILQLNDYHDIE